MNGKLSFQVWRYPRGIDELFPYRRGVGFLAKPAGDTFTRVHNATVDERGGQVELTLIGGYALITVAAICNRRENFRYVDGDSLSGFTLCLARMQQIADRLGLTDDIDWPSGWPVDPEQLEFLLNWRLYEETMRELKQEAAAERRRQDDIKYEKVREKAAAREQRAKLWDMNPHRVGNV